jgi:hypothetical protein
MYFPWLPAEAALSIPTLDFVKTFLEGIRENKEDFYKYHVLRFLDLSD